VQPDGNKSCVRAQSSGSPGSVTIDTNWDDPTAAGKIQLYGGSIWGDVIFYLDVDEWTYCNASMGS